MILTDIDAILFVTVYFLSVNIPHCPTTSTTAWSEMIIIIITLCDSVKYNHKNTLSVQGPYKSKQHRERHTFQILRKMKTTNTLFTIFVRFRSSMF